MFPRMDSSESKSDDFRSVIDDLTVENQRLRRRLRKYEELDCSHLQNDKLFEVRYHGLSAHKKRELEETLRRFTSSLEQASGRPNPTLPSEPLSRAPVQQPSHLESLSSTPYSRPADSAYASMFPAGDTMLDKLHDEPSRVRIKDSRKHDLDAFVCAVPDGPFGADRLRRSEKIKTKLVVRKLEQLFTGRESASKACSQPQQQKEVFQSAAKADTSTKKASGHRVLFEGVREARILPADAESLPDGTSNVRLPGILQLTHHIGCSSARSRSEDVNASADSSFEQRPTRPLDIDPNRAQIPAENMEYIRHLGFSSSLVEPNATGEDGEGWVYLNLLISMAQLHTLNVTPVFVRKAVAEVSDRLELSRDGRKLRWKGGTEGTRMSSDVGSSGDQPNEKSPDDLTGRSGKRRRLGNERFDSDPLRHEYKVVSSPAGMLQHLNERTTDDEHQAKTRHILLGQVHARNGLDYQPLFRHATCSEEDGCSVRTSKSMTWPGTAGDSHSVAVSQKRATDPLETKNGHGPIVFYQGASFCTDLSGDVTYRSEGAIMFGQWALDPLGSTQITSKQAAHDADDFRSSSKTSEAFPDNLDHGDDRSGSGTADLQFPTMHLTGSDAAWERVVPLEFEASGIGGVQPYDNFTISVRVRQVTSALEQRDSKTPTTPEEHQQLLFNTTCKGSSRKKTPMVGVRGEIVSTVTTNLPPSPLPPPSYYLSLSPSETDDDNETESDSNDSRTNNSRSPQIEAEPTAPRYSIQAYRTAGSLGSQDMSEEVSNLDADNHAG